MVVCSQKKRQELNQSRAGNVAENRRSFNLVQSNIQVHFVFCLM